MYSFLKGSHVVTISLMGGIQGSLKFPGLAAYSSSKAVITHLSVIEEYKEQGIAFNVLALDLCRPRCLKKLFQDTKRLFR
jgi:NAD(P)-dependent dehydrogenase (short-subunit alcohol dehydrogenase family)